MACVVTFWQMPDEEVAFFEYLTRKDDVCAFPFDAVTDPRLIYPTPLSHLLHRQDADRIALTLEEYAGSPRIFEFQREGLDDSVQYALEYDFPCLVYVRGTLANGQLSQSNVSAYTYFLDESTNVVRNHPDPFVKWIRRVMSWLRKSTPEWHQYRGYRATKMAAKEAMTGLVLVPYHGWVGPSTGKSSFMPDGNQ